MTNWIKLRYFIQILILTLMMVVPAGCTSSATAPPRPNPTSTPFSYLLRVEEEGTGKYISEAKVTLEVSGLAPLQRETDSAGVARFQINAAHLNQAGFLIVETVGYRRYRRNIDLIEGVLPSVVKLVPSVASGPTATPINIAAAAVTPTPTEPLTPTLRPQPTNTPSATPTPELSKPPTATPQPSDTPTPTATPILEPIATFTPPPPTPISIPPNMAFIPTGEFLMGSLEDSSGLPGLDRNPEVEPDELPQRTVFLPEFWIDKTEVTNRAYRACVQAGVCSLQFEGNPDYHNNPAFDDYPAIYVSWDQAKAFCEWTGKRLPTEAEWEKAARGDDGRIWPWGNFLKDNPVQPVDRAHVADGNAPDVTAVGSYPQGASPYGVLDMSGNVWEWTNDWYKFDYYRDRYNFLEDNQADNSPLGPPEGESNGRKVIRGGSYRTVGVDARTAERNAVPTGPLEDVGFRCVVSGSN